MLQKANISRTVQNASEHFGTILERAWIPNLDEKNNKKVVLISLQFGCVRLSSFELHSFELHSVAFSFIQLPFV